MTPTNEYFYHSLRYGPANNNNFDFNRNSRRENNLQRGCLQLGFSYFVDTSQNNKITEFDGFFLDGVPKVF